jgi:hypothetical protein
VAKYANCSVREVETEWTAEEFRLIYMHMIEDQRRERNRYANAGHEKEPRLSMDGLLQAGSRMGLVETVYYKPKTDT